MEPRVRSTLIVAGLLILAAILYFAARSLM